MHILCALYKLTAINTQQMSLVVSRFGTRRNVIKIITRIENVEFDSC